MTSSAIKWFAAFALCLVLQTTLIPVVAIAGRAPDLLLIALFILAIRNGMMTATLVGFFLGLGMDVYTPASLGQHALAMSVTGFCMGIFNERLMRTDAIMKLSILLAAFFVHDTLYTIVTIVTTGGSAGTLFVAYFTQTLPRALYSAVVAAILYAWVTFVNPSFRR